VGTVAVLGAELLAENSVAGIFGPDKLPQRLFGFAIRLGDRVESALLLVGDEAGAAEARQRFGGCRIRQAPQKFGRNVQAHLLLPKCHQELPVSVN